MGKIKNMVVDFLEQSRELNLGYNDNSVPPMEDMGHIIRHRIGAYEYWKK